MTYYTDEHFQIGSTHLANGTPCQDYALSGVLDDRAFAIVSDGCSSGGLTDIGARLVCLSAATALREHIRLGNSVTDTTPDEVTLHERIVLAGVRQILGLTPTDLLATCAMAYLTPDGGFVHLEGDGVIALVQFDGTTELIRYDWRENTPFYPAYHDNGLNAFIAHHGGNIDAPALSYERRTGDEIVSGTHTLREGIRGITIPLAPDTYEFVAVFSDGVTQVEHIDWATAAHELLAFKNLHGQFATRRMKRFVHDAEKQGKGAQDDIAFAVIRAERTPEGDDNACDESERSA